MYFIEIILLVVIIALGVYFVFRKKDPRDAQKEADKILGKAIPASVYCAANSISEEDLRKQIGRSEIKAYECMGMLFVQDTAAANNKP